MSRIAARLRPSQSVGDTIRAEADLGTLWFTGSFFTFLEPQFGPGVTFTRGGNQLTFLKTSTRPDWEVVTSGPDYVLATASGRLFAWGASASFRTGLDTTATITVPTQVIPASGPDTGWTAVAAGNTHSLGIRDGELFAWGSNLNGQTGFDVTTGDTTVPTQVEGFDDWVAVSCGIQHSLGVRANGQLYAWGRNADFRTGLGDSLGSTNVPTQVGTDTDWLTVSAGNNHSLALKQDGTAWSWGSNASGKTGQGTTAGQTQTPTQMGTNTNWTAVSAGNTHSMGIEDGVIVTCGSNLNGRTGRGSTFGSVTVMLPVTQTNLSGDPIDVRAHDQHSVAITTTGVFTCGNNSNGRTGLDTTVGSQTTYVPVAGPIQGFFGSFDRLVQGFYGDNAVSRVLQRKKV